MISVASNVICLLRDRVCVVGERSFFLHRDGVKLGKSNFKHPPSLRVCVCSILVMTFDKRSIVGGQQAVAHCEQRRPNGKPSILDRLQNCHVLLPHTVLCGGLCQNILVF